MVCTFTKPESYKGAKDRRDGADLSLFVAFYYSFQGFSGGIGNSCKDYPKKQSFRLQSQRRTDLQPGTSTLKLARVFHSVLGPLAD